MGSMRGRPLLVLAAVSLMAQLYLASLLLSHESMQADVPVAAARKNERSGTSASSSSSEDAAATALRRASMQFAKRAALRRSSRLNASRAAIEAAASKVRIRHARFNISVAAVAPDAQESAQELPASGAIMIQSDPVRTASMVNSKPSSLSQLEPPPVTPLKAKLPTTNEWTGLQARRAFGAMWADVHRQAQRLGLNVSQQSYKVSGDSSIGAPHGAHHGAHTTHSSSWRHRCRRFAVGTRHDYRGSVSAALRALGLCETHSAHWDVYWGEQWLKPEQFANGAIAEHALVNSIPGFRSSFGDKFAFARLHDSCLAQRDGAEGSKNNRTRGVKGTEQPLRRTSLRASSSPSSSPSSASSSSSSSSSSTTTTTTASSSSSSTTSSSIPSPRSDGMPYCDWTKRGFNYVRRGEGLVDGPVSELRAHALELARSQGGDRNELPHQMWILKPQQSFNQVRFSLSDGLGWPLMASDDLLNRWQVC